MSRSVHERYCTTATEWPTIGLIALNTLAFMTLTWFYHQVHWWVVLPIGGYIIALFGSLQHEVLHGHPTSKQWLNEALVFPNIALWTPYALYKKTHLTHHINDQLTDPTLDPESYYLTPEKWLASPAWKQAYYRFYNTFIGRFFWGPIHTIATLWFTDLCLILGGNREVIRYWLLHGLACLPVLYWVLVVCDIQFWAYLAFFIYPGVSLTLMRSFIEHQAVETVGERSIIVETMPLLSLMYLNNNLHAIHHQRPHLAWFRLPEVWRSDHKSVLAGNRHYYFNGYLKIICRYWRIPKEQPNYPLEKESI